MDLSRLLSLIEDMPAYRQLLGELKQETEHVRAGVLEAAKPYFIAALVRSLRIPLLVVTAQPEDAEKLFEQLSAWCGVGVRLIPEPDALPYQRVAPDPTTELERVQALAALARPEPRGGIFVSSAPALMQKTAPYKEFVSEIHAVKVGTVIEPFRLLERWGKIGYRLENMVEVPGTMSHRGGIVDIYPPSSELPARLEFFGNTVDSIRLFKPETQRSQARVESVTITPTIEMLTALGKNTNSPIKNLDLSGLNPEARERFERELDTLADRQEPRSLQFYSPLFNTGSLLDYLPGDALLVLDKPRSIAQVAADFEAKGEELRGDQIGRGELPAGFPKPYLEWDELEERFERQRRLELVYWDADGSLRLDFAPAPRYAGQLSAFIDRTRELLKDGKRLILTSYQSSRLAELLEEQQIIALPIEELRGLPSAGSLTLAKGSPGEGWVMGGETYLLTDTELFGFTKERRLAKKRPVARHKLLDTLKPGAYVVHIEHGIGKFAGVTTMKTNGSQREYLVLRYAAGDRLLVPIDQIDRVDRYIGASEKPPTLSRLGTQEWLRTKQKTKEAAENVARELLGLYAEREVAPGFAFSPDSVWQQELEASFPYVETPDQIEVQKHIKADMEQPKPMDRLVCGDVGYGKTEVALRAAFKAVMDGRQVAVLVPTTVLAEQHYTTFTQRLGAFPVRVEVLSRFRKPREQKRILEGLANGSVDICIGTHRLLQKDVVFKDLGLLIIDEEQRFGVAHKEHLKKMRREVDVLTLSATPIPRTLSMALAGVRDMSVMETPPEDRLPVKTYVAEYDDRLVREAILQELERNGQVFFVHNRVQGIRLVAEKLRAIVPEAKIAIAHGQMREDELAGVMRDFAEGIYNVLACTTIIESGLDMPRVNTLIVNRADKFGLTQLYQLRGRVGRGASLAYAYFLHDRQKTLTPTAEKRLRTIFEATELGAGFTIAMKDLEIRGAGNLLGMKQSGFISAVGFSLYTRLLAEAVEELKAQRAGIEKPKVPKLPPPSVDLPLSAYIPEDYVSDLGTRLSLYQNMVAADSPEQVEALAVEFRDRFGAPPPEVENLLYTVKIKALAAKAGIESVSTLDSQILLRRFAGMRFDRQKLEEFLRDGVKVAPLQVRLNLKQRNWQEMLDRVLRRV